MDIIKKERVVVEYADTLGELQVKGIGWNHDHAWFHFFGQTKNVPEDLQEFITEDKKYVLIAEDDEPPSGKLDIPFKEDYDENDYKN